MNRQTTKQEARIPLLHGWLSSITLHGLVLLSVFPLFRQSVIPAHNEPFHWDVALVHTIPTAHNSVQTADTTKSAVPKQPDRRSTVPHANHTIQHAISFAEHIAPFKPQAVAPAAPNSMPDNSSPVTSVSETTTTSIPNELSSPLAQSAEPPSQQTETPVASTTPALPRLETATASATLDKNTPPNDNTQPTPAPTTVSDTAAPSAIRPDYGWLQQAIFQRLEELKGSSRPSLDESRPLKVTIKAVVSREGILLDSAVVKSSGLDRIDQEAMALVQQAFPIQLDHPLDRGQIAMRIPITYSRE